MSGEALEVSAGLERAGHEALVVVGLQRGAEEPLVVREMQPARPL